MLWPIDLLAIGDNMKSYNNPFVNKNYDNIHRFISYYYQIDLVRELGAETVLEIGIGNRTVTNYLKQHNLQVTTCDIDKRVNPDFVADIRDLPFECDSYDVVLAFQVLEHLPWDNVPQALKELNRVTKKYVIISIPYFSAAFELVMKFPLVHKIIKKPFVDIFFRVPYLFNNIPLTSGHCWELGRRNYSLKKVRATLRSGFEIVKEIRPVLNPGHYFFVLTKK